MGIIPNTRRISKYQRFLHDQKMGTQEISLELIPKEPEADRSETLPVEGHGNPNNESEDKTEENNANNNQLGEFSESTNPVDRKKRPSILGNFAFLLAIVDIVLASVCTWFWYNWIWFLAVPAFVGGLIALTCSDNPKMSFLWAASSSVLSCICIAWSAAMLAICFQMCACNYFGDKRSQYNQMLFRIDDDHHHHTSDAEVVPCVHVRFPPLPVEKSEAEADDYCYYSPITLALFGFRNGYKATKCESPSNKICKKFDWFQEKREEERSGEWAWTGGENVLAGDKNVPIDGACHLDSDCENFPNNLCFGNDVHSSVCDNGTGVDIGGGCNFDHQCELGRQEREKRREIGKTVFEDYECNYDKTVCKQPPEFKFKCIDHSCVVRSNCLGNLRSGNKYASELSKGVDYCEDECSCCSGCNKMGRCVRGKGKWQCDCSQGSYGPNCMYLTTADELANGQKGLCQYMWKLCKSGKCEASWSEPSGFQCICDPGQSGQYCQL